MIQIETQFRKNRRHFCRRLQNRSGMPGRLPSAETMTNKLPEYRSMSEDPYNAGYAAPTAALGYRHERRIFGSPIMRSTSRRR
jgi:hypothetical protein